jgi:hypothetical protein
MAANPKSDVASESEKTDSVTTSGRKNDTRFHVYHAEARILSGHLKHPIAQPVEFEGHSILSKTRREGHITRSSDGGSLEGLVSFKAGHTRASGSMVQKTDTWGNVHSGWVTLSTSVLEGLNVFEVITADRVVAQVSTEHPVEKGHVPKVTFLGTRFENLRVGGYPVEVQLDLGICGQKPADDRPYLDDVGFLDRVEKGFSGIADATNVPDSLRVAYREKISYIDKLKKGERSKCSKLVCSLVKSIAPIPIPGVEIFGNLILIPDFGTVALGEIEVGIEPGHLDFPEKQVTAIQDDPPSSNYFTLNMINMHLGCIGGGAVTAATARTNGMTRP